MQRCNRMTVKGALAAMRPAAVSAAIAVVAIAIAGCGSSTSASDPSGRIVDGTALYGALPTPGAAKSRGTITIGQLTGQTPTYIFPIEAAANTSNQTEDLVSSLFVPLYGEGDGAAPTIDFGLGVANPPRFSDGDRKVTIPLKRGLKWSNGAPVDASDVLFYIDLLKAAVHESAANWGEYTPGLFPDNVSRASAPNRYTVVLHLDKPYNPGYFLNDQMQITGTGIYPLPSTDWNVASPDGPHLQDWSDPAVARTIYNYLSKAGASVSTFASDPLWKDVDGPFTLKDFNATNSSYELAANQRYGLSPEPAAADISYQTFTSASSELTELSAGTLDVDPNLDSTQLAQAPALRRSGVSVFGGPTFGWTGGTINFKDKTNDFDKVIAQVYVRQAIDHLIDQPTIIKGIDKNAAVPVYGPVPAEPRSPYTPSDASMAPFPYRPATAVSLLRSHGWKVVPGGQTTCARSGTGAGECGAGIPADTPLKFVWATPPESAAATYVLTSDAVASIAKQAAGINILLQSKSFNFLYTDYNDENPGARGYTNDWGVNNSGGITNLDYPTQEGTQNSGAAFNVGGYDDRTANRLMKASASTANPLAVKTEASYIEKHPPVFYLPEQDTLAAVSNRVGGPSSSWLALLTQDLELPQFWYLKR